MDSLVTHPLFEYRVSYRRLLEIPGAAAGKRLIEGAEISVIPGFCDAVGSPISSGPAVVKQPGTALSHHALSYWHDWDELMGGDGQV